MAIKCFCICTKIGLACSDHNLNLLLLGGMGVGDTERKSQGCFLFFLFFFFLAFQKAHGTEFKTAILRLPETHSLEERLILLWVSLSK